MRTFTNENGKVTVYNSVEDLLDGRPVYRYECSGDAEALGASIGIEHYPGGEFTAWIESHSPIEETLLYVGWAGLPPLRSTPCGCYACNRVVQAGHFACATPPEWALRLEELGLTSRRYEDGAWKWA